MASPDILLEMRIRNAMDTVLRGMKELYAVIEEDGAEELMNELAQDPDIEAKTTELELLFKQLGG